MRKRELKALLKVRDAEIERLKDELRELSGEKETLQNAELFIPRQLEIHRLPDFDMNSAGPWNPMG